MKKTPLLVIIVLILVSLGGFVMADSQADKIYVVEKEPEWKNIKSTGEEINLTFWTLDAKDKKTELGWIPDSGSCTGWEDKYLFDENGVEILDDKAKPLKVKCESAKCDGANCYHITLTEAAAVNINDYVKLGNDSSVSVYQNESRVEFAAFDWYNISAVIYKNVGGNFTLYPDDIFVYYNNNQWKFGANDTSETNESWNQYLYDFNSYLPLVKKGSNYYYKHGVDAYKINLGDICTGSASCEFLEYDTLDDSNRTVYHLQVTFWSNNFIDPTYSFEVLDGQMILDDVIFEGANFTHLNISGTAPYDSLVAYWSFDADNGTAYDLTENNNDGVYTDDAHRNTTCTSNFGDCLTLDGTADRIPIPDSPSLNITHNITITAWVNTFDNTDAGYIIAKDGVASNRNWALYTGCAGTPKNVSFYIFAAGDIKRSCGPSLTNHKWHFVAGRYNGTHVSVNVDGTWHDPVAATYHNNATTTIMIGADSASTSPFSGHIDELMIFDSALDYDEVDNIYKNQSARFKSSGEQTHRLIYNASGYNIINLTLDDYETNFDTNVQYRMGYWNNDTDYKEYDFGNRHAVIDGDGDYITLLDHPYLSFGDGTQDKPFSLSIWLNYNNYTNTRVISKRTNTGSGTLEWLFYINTNKQPALMLVDDNSGHWVQMKSNSIVPTVNQWTHLVATYDGRGGISAYEGIRLYINSTNISLTASANGAYDYMHNTDTPIHIGVSDLDATPNYGNGSLDEVMIFNDTLTQSEITEIYNLGRDFDNYDNESLRVRLDLNQDFTDRKGLRNGAESGDTHLESNNNNLVAYFHFDNSTGLNDSIAGYQGIVNDQIVRVNESGGIYGGALYLESNDNQLNLNHSGSNFARHLMNKTELTFSLWLRNNEDSTSSERVLIDDSGTGTAPFLELNWLADETYEIQMEIKPSGIANSIVSDVDYRDDRTYHHIVGRYNGSELSMWIDGVKQADTATDVGRTTYEDGAIRLGESSSDSWRGHVDELMFWNRSLTDKEIREIYVKGRARWLYTIEANISQNLTVPTGTTHLLPELILESDSNNFYSPYIIQSGYVYLDLSSDNSPPTFDEYPNNISLVAQLSTLYVEVNASDENGIDQFWVNDTTNFNITFSGQFTNATNISVGVYYVNISVNDTSNNVNFLILNVNVTSVDSTPPEFTEYPNNRTIQYFTEPLNVDINATDETEFDTWWINDTTNFNISQLGVLINATDLAIGVYYINVSVNDTSNNVNFLILNVNVTDEAPPVVSDFTFTAMNSSRIAIGGDSYFNTANLTPIEYMQVNFTLTDPNGIVGDISLFFTAAGKKGCSLGNNQSEDCYNVTNNQWVEYRNKTNTINFKDEGNQGDFILCNYTGSSTVRYYSCLIDEHYNPNVFKWYSANYNFSDVKWQTGVNQRISKNKFIKIEVNNTNIPLDADQYKLDFRGNYSSSGLLEPLEAYACNSSYTTGDPEDLSECSIVASRLPSQFQDDGTKFRAIFTKELVDTLGDIRYIILESHLVNPTDYYYIKSYASKNAGWTTHWEYSTTSGTTWLNLGDGYETELNINWFYNGAAPTRISFKVESNDTNANFGNSSIYNLTWSIDPAQNYPPIVSIISPENNESMTDSTLYINWTVAEPNDDSYTTNITIDNTVIASNLASTFSNYTYNLDLISTGWYNLTVQACETGTTELYCTNSTHEIYVLNSAPKFTEIPQNDTLVYNTELFKQINASGAAWFIINDTTRFNITRTGQLRNGTTLGVGDYFLNITINDTVDQTNTTHYNLTVTQATPTLTTSVTGTVVYPTPPDYTGSESNIGDSGCTYNLYRNNTLIDTGSSVSNDTRLGVGHYEFNYNTTGCENYTSTEDTELFIVQINTTGIVNLTLNGTDGQYTQTEGDVNITARMITPSTFNLTLYNNGTFMQKGYMNLTNISNFEIGHYNITATSGDDNYTNLYETHLLIITALPDTTPPNWTLPFPANASLEFMTDNLTADFDATDGTAINFFINDTTNFRIGDAGVLGNETSLAVGIYYVNVSVNDTGNNVNSTIYFVRVNDTTAPSFTEIPANVTLQFNTDALSVDINATDFTSVHWKINDTTRFNISQLGVLINTTTLAVGSYYVNVSINDSYDNWNYLLFKADVTLITPPISIAIDPSTSETYPSLTTATGSGCPSELVCNLSRNTTPFVNPETTTLAVGHYNYTYNTSGNENYSAYSVSTVLIIGLNNSAVINLTLNGTDGTHQQIYGTVNITAYMVTPTVGNISIEVNGTEQDKGYTRLENISDWSTGHYNITAIFTNANYSSVQESHLLDIIDLSPPSFTEIPHNRTIEYKSEYLYIEINATDTDTFYFYINDTTNFKINAVSGVFENNTLLETGVYYINITANDTYNNANWFTLNVNVTDTTPPTINLTSPINHTSYAAGSITFAAETTDGEAVYWIYNYTGSGGNITIAGASSSFSEAKTLTSGTYDVYVWGRDNHNLTTLDYELKVVVNSTTLGGYQCDVRVGDARITDNEVLVTVATLGSNGQPEDHSLTSDCYARNGTAITSVNFTHLATGKYYANYTNTQSGFCYVRDVANLCGVDTLAWDKYDVGGTEKMNIAIVIGLTLFAILFIVIGLYLFFSRMR